MTKELSGYALYNAALQNNWTLSEVAREFGVTPDAAGLAKVKAAIEAAGGRVVAGRVK